MYIYVIHVISLIYVISVVCLCYVLITSVVYVICFSSDGLWTALARTTTYIYIYIHTYIHTYIYIYIYIYE